MPRVFQHRIETRLPLQLDRRLLEIIGWCVIEGSTALPDVKAVWSRGEIRLTRRVSRPDVATTTGTSASEEPWGFVLSGEVPPGAHLLTLMATESGKNEWQCLQRFTVIVSSRGLQAQIEHPPSGDIRENVRIQGWCFHFEKPIAALWLHYGTRRIACEFGLPRPDLSAIAPNAPNASRSGFITAKNIAAGRGPLRLVALDSEGTRHVVRTDRFVDVNCDEENPGGLNLPTKFARVSPARRSLVPLSRSPFEQGSPPKRLRVLFALYGDLTSNSALHVVALANAMAEAGHECLVAVPDNPETVSRHAKARFRTVAFNSVTEPSGLFSNGQPPDVIHAWTTREVVRHFCSRLREVTGAKLIVHLEDNEQQILEKNVGQSLSRLLDLPHEELDKIAGTEWSHPRRSDEFLRSSDGVSVIIEKLREFVPSDVPVHVFWPAADSSAFFPRPVPQDLREALGWGAGHTVVFYHGNVHAANAGEVGELYAGVAQLNATGCPTTLVRCGRDSVDFRADRAHVISLGEIKNHHVAPLMALADFFVQPGEADAFNEYRFPSKLPEFFSIGRPVILPRTNLGRVVRHLEDAYVLEQANAEGIAAAVRALRSDPALRAHLSAGAVAFRAKHFSWLETAKALLEFYHQVLSAPRADPIVT